ncbi:MAG TPA: GNAT family N-acetyltransferase [Candidatus Sulfotelmatobacter sp.]|nr:GNAT family N-acetyltransferase [Candidatus Sulfotelmatobacter sp.]
MNSALPYSGIEPSLTPRLADGGRAQTRPGTQVKSLLVRKYETLADVESLRPCWDELLREFPGATTFSSWEWLAPWWGAFGQGRQLMMLEFLDEHSDLVGLAPLCVEKCRVIGFMQLRVLRFWGDGSGDSDNLDFPVRVGYENEVAAAMLHYLSEESSRWDYCELNTMPEGSAVGNCLTWHLHQRAWLFYHHQQTGSAISLPESWEEYRAQLSSKERGKVNYRNNLLERKYQVRYYRCENEGELGVCLDILFTLHQKRWQSAGEPGSFGSAARRKFYAEMAALLLERGCLEFWVLDLNDSPVATQFGFCFDRTFFSLQEGYDPLFSVDSVGYVLRAHVIRHLIAAGVRRYDFLAGEAESKARWNAGVTQYRSVHFARPASRGSIYLRTIKSATDSKEWLRQKLPDGAWQALHWLNCTLLGIKKRTSRKA